ncbi:MULTISPECIES: dipeptide/oligopeptide/nickel ABC transporter permease/ATP-binding protein [Microbacterium]|uniref:Dipeptide/oligopeptide/nickel ABC transporter permease/ATP-binding protein n=1 Tax=Microbacterium algeriense TaxID=2615184 RepID=A0ABQ6VBX8_9MICO|nr:MULTISPECIES: dipeptide/oligopeptide/nickel ABC transporter permease/ATP-binding protein [Microbacterium]AZH80201.1 ABC transporter [Microbacterium sp. Y-01]KAB1866569.1 dipeptide/oligopeptide/nickel ABC transporter permease/ATP-binding protein [Microbacterium algeriense]MDX2399015.1 dipeptide/oligopeptide/nickel ABC transporter permease/ATP-binding protein [Microbacterium algeriense]
MRRRLTERLSVPGLRWGRLSLGSIICLAVLAIIALAAILAPLISPYDPLASGSPVQPPSAEHWFGTDRQGRDIFSRLVYGARYSLVIGLGATLVALAVACVLGTIAATAPKWISETLMRVMDVIMSFPGIALAAVFVAVFGKSLPVLVLTIAFLYVPQLTRIVRANILDQYGEDYVSAVRVMGAGTPRIIVRHVARNAMAPVLVFATVLVADAIVFEASLSFLQAGVPDPEPSWGNVIAAGRNLLMSGAWWATFFPGILIMITVLCLNILSEGMTDAMVSPRARKITADAANTEESTHDLEEAAVPDDTHVIPTVDTAVNLSVPSGVPDVLVPTAEAVPLAERLAELRARELARTDRLVYTGDAAPLLEVQDLCISFPRHGDVDVVDHVSFSVRPGETMSLVGESGCGKSITSLAIMGLLDPKADIRGRILFDGKDLLRMTPKERNALRGHDIAMIYQDALSSLNPAMLIRAQMKQLTSRGGTRTAEELLELVGLDPKRTLASYPHELSGGQRQRVLIAMALTRDPRLVIADEPTTALDVTVQAQVVELLMRLQRELGFALVFVSHDLALVAELSHRITVMYAGQVVEQGTTREVLTQPVHEYTQGLLGAVLSIEAGSDRLHQVSGVVPSPRDFPQGDRFAPRSTDPARYAGVEPVRRHIDGTEHYYSAHPADAPVEPIGAGR